MKKHFIIIILFSLILSSCEFFRKLDKSSSENSSIDTNKEGSLRKDSSGTKSDKTYTKETFFYPGRDTTINNFIFQPEAKQQQPVVYIRETGQEKTEQAQVIVDTSWKDFARLLVASQSEKKTETEGSVLGTGTIIAIAVAGFVLLLLIIAIFYIIKKLNVVNLLINQK